MFVTIPLIGFSSNAHISQWKIIVYRFIAENGLENWSKIILWIGYESWWIFSSKSMWWNSLITNLRLPSQNDRAKPLKLISKNKIKSNPRNVVKRAPVLCHCPLFIQNWMIDAACKRTTLQRLGNADVCLSVRCEFFACMHAYLCVYQWVCVDAEAFCFVLFCVSLFLLLLLLCSFLVPYSVLCFGCASRAHAIRIKCVPWFFSLINHNNCKSLLLPDLATVSMFSFDGAIFSM